jgi:hypothetical protein
MTIRSSSLDGTIETATQQQRWESTQFHSKERKSYTPNSGTPKSHLSQYNNEAELEEIEGGDDG